MENMKIGQLVKALNTVGQVYRNRDGSKPADPVTKLVQQFDGFGDMTLAEWVASKQSSTLKKTNKQTKANVDQEKIDVVLTRLQLVKSQTELRSLIKQIKLSASEKQTLAKVLTGKSSRSGKAALELVETYHSDRLLLETRVDEVEKT